MEGIERAIRHGAVAGKLRAYVRENGETGLAGLLRLADRYSALAGAELEGVADDAERSAAGLPHVGVPQSGRAE